MSTIIALTGLPNVGKSTTIGVLYELMLLKDFDIFRDRAVRHSHEFFAILSKNGRRIGVSTYGDSVRHISRHNEIFLENQCDIIVCACRPDGEIWEALRATRGFITDEPILKVAADTDTARYVENENDARELFNRIESLIR